MFNISKIFVTLLLFTSAAIAAPCNFSDIKTISGLSTYVSSPATFDYKYQYFKATDPKAPVIMFLTGGPGQTAIGSQRQAFPSDFGQIQIDPRGIGCNMPNSKTAYEKEFYSTKNYIKDLVEVVKDAGVTSNLIIYGISYGTIVATRLASALERESIHPKAVVLEGVLAKAFTPSTPPFKSYVSPLQGIFDQLTQKSQDKWGDIWKGEAHLGIPPRRWYGHLVNMIFMGYVPVTTEMQITQLESLLSREPEEQAIASTQRLAQYVMEQPAPLALLTPFNTVNSPSMRVPILLGSQIKINPAIHQRALYQSIACGEIEAYSGQTIGFAKGHFLLTQIPQQYSVCQPGDLIEPYESSDHQIQAPIYYMQGTSDPATPHYLALEHFHNQRLAQKRFFVSFNKAGHNPLAGNITQLGGGCHLDFWQDVAEAKNPEASLKTCSINFDIRTQ